LSAGDWCIILLAVGVVLSAELFNTALETLADVVTEETHPGIGRVKDVAAAAVLIVCVISVIVGVIVFAKYV
ncbi:MAG TPA: diacylglycerol kinase family protein, partial [Cyclobacteriaceae bacterium]|nr:diacylglycerol kinase family protein [Cyclobacteriaceae bacterium]